MLGIDLVDELVRQIVLTSGTTESTDSIRGLSQQGDDVTLLRY